MIIQKWSALSKLGSLHNESYRESEYYNRSFTKLFDYNPTNALSRSIFVKKGVATSEDLVFSVSFQFRQRSNNDIVMHSKLMVTIFFLFIYVTY